MVFGRWIHKDGKSRPDKRFKNVNTQAKKAGARKAANTKRRKKK